MRKIYCMIPARAGSKRVPSKNLRYLLDKPLIAHAIECAKACGDSFTDIYVNTDSETILALANSFGVKGYKRDAWLASDEAQGDDFTFDFMDKLRPDIVVMISPVCPLITPTDVQSAMQIFSDSSCDTLISCEQTHMQTFCDGCGVNIDPTKPLGPSQDNPPVQILNWAVAIWDVPTFLASYRARKNGYLGTNRILFPIEPLHALKISHEADFRRAECLLRAMQHDPTAQTPPVYWTPS